MSGIEYIIDQYDQAIRAETEALKNSLLMRIFKFKGWPAPTGKPIGARLVGGPDHGRIAPLIGFRCEATPILLKNGFVWMPGSYRWERDENGEIIGKYEPHHD